MSLLLSCRRSVGFQKVIVSCVNEVVGLTRFSVVKEPVSPKLLCPLVFLLCSSSSRCDWLARLTSFRLSARKVGVIAR